MKEHQIAILGVRLIGLASIAFGCVIAISMAVMHYFFQFPLGEIATSDLHLHDTYFVVTTASYDLVVPGTSGVVVGVFLWLSSKWIGRLLTRGLNETKTTTND